MSSTSYKTFPIGNSGGTGIRAAEGMVLLCDNGYILYIDVTDPDNPRCAQPMKSSDLARPEMFALIQQMARFA